MREPRDVLRTCIALLPGELQASNAFGIAIGLRNDRARLHTANRHAYRRFLQGHPRAGNHGRSRHDFLRTLAALRTLKRRMTHARGNDNHLKHMTLRAFIFVAWHVVPLAEAVVSAERI